MSPLNGFLIVEVAIRFPFCHYGSLPGHVLFLDIHKVSQFWVFATYCMCHEKFSIIFLRTYDLVHVRFQVNS